MYEDIWIINWISFSYSAGLTDSKSLSCSGKLYASNIENPFQSNYDVKSNAFCDSIDNHVSSTTENMTNEVSDHIQFLITEVSGPTTLTKLRNADDKEKSSDFRLVAGSNLFPFPVKLFSTFIVHSIPFRFSHFASNILQSVPISPDVQQKNGNCAGRKISS